MNNWSLIWKRGHFCNRFPKSCMWRRVFGKKHVFSRVIMPTVQLLYISFRLIMPLCTCRVPVLWSMDITFSLVQDWDWQCMGNRMQSMIKSLLLANSCPGLSHCSNQRLGFEKKLPKSEVGIRLPMKRLGNERPHDVAGPQPQDPQSTSLMSMIGS